MPILYRRIISILIILSFLSQNVCAETGYSCLASKAFTEKPDGRAEFADRLHRSLVLKASGSDVLGEDALDIRIERIKRIQKLYQRQLKQAKIQPNSTDKGVYFPASVDHIFGIMRILGIEKGKRFIDLGSGDGRVAIIASIFGLNAVGYEADKRLFNFGLDMERRILGRNGIVDFRNSDLTNDPSLNLAEYDVLYYFTDGAEDEQELLARVADKMKDDGLFVVYGDKPGPGLITLPYVDIGYAYIYYKPNCNSSLVKRLEEARFRINIFEGEDKNCAFIRLLETVFLYDWEFNHSILKGQGASSGFYSTFTHSERSDSFAQFLNKSPDMQALLKEFLLGRLVVNGKRKRYLKTILGVGYSKAVNEGILRWLVYAAEDGKISKEYVSDILTSMRENKSRPPKGSPATLLRWMKGEGIFIEKRTKAGGMAHKRGGNDSPRNIGREIDALLAVGLIEGDKDNGYYLPEWIKNTDINEIISDNPSLDSASLSEEKEKLDILKRRILRFKISGQEDIEWIKINASEIEYIERRESAILSISRVKYGGEEYWAKYVDYPNPLLEKLFDAQARLMTYMNTLNIKGIVKVRHFLETETGKRMILFDKLPEGCHLGRLIINYGELSEYEAVGIILKVLDIVRRLYENGICHWDIKPDNIWICEDGDVILFDYDFSFMTKDDFYKKGFYRQRTVGYESERRRRWYDREEERETIIRAEPIQDEIYSIAITFSAMIRRSYMNISSPELYNIMQRAISCGGTGYYRLDDFINDLRKYQHEEIRKQMPLHREGISGTVRANLARMGISNEQIGYYYYIDSIKKYIERTKNVLRDIDSKKKFSLWHLLRRSGRQTEIKKPNRRFHFVIDMEDENSDFENIRAFVTMVMEAFSEYEGLYDYAVSVKNGTGKEIALIPFGIRPYEFERHKVIRLLKDIAEKKLGKVFEHAKGECFVFSFNGREMVRVPGGTVKVNELKNIPAAFKACLEMKLEEQAEEAQILDISCPPAVPIGRTEDRLERAVLSST